MKCKGCGYSLWNVPGRTCPECGRGFVPSEFEFRANAVEFCCPGCMQQYYGSDQHGLLVPRAFACVRCHAPCDMDSMILRAAPGVPDDAVELHRVAWEDPLKGGVVRRFFATVRDGMARPSQIGDALRGDVVVRKATWYAVSVLSVVAVPSVLGFVLITLIAPMMGSGSTRSGGAALRTALWESVGGVCAVLASWYILGLVGLAFLAWMTSLTLRMCGERVPWKVVWCSFTYALGPMVILAVPCLGIYCGSLPASIWWVVAACIILARAASVTGWKVIVSVLAPLLLIGALVTALFAFVVLPPISAAMTAAAQVGSANATTFGPPAPGDAADESEAGSGLDESAPADVVEPGQVDITDPNQEDAP
ncbi:MAG: hypothetical protein RI986_127 [Planctomycetota bacterium]